jgi:hypothetical protein
MVLLVGIIIIIVIILSIIPYALNGEGGETMQNQMANAVNEIRIAYAHGADVSSLVERFNIGLDLLRQEETGQFNTCTDGNDCHQKAIKEFAFVSSEAMRLGNMAEQESTVQKMIYFAVYVPLGAFVGSFLIVLTQKILRTIETKKFQNSIVEEDGGEP